MVHVIQTSSDSSIYKHLYDTDKHDMKWYYVCMW